MAPPRGDLRLARTRLGTQLKGLPRASVPVIGGGTKSCPCAVTEPQQTGIKVMMTSFGQSRAEKTVASGARGQVGSQPLMGTPDLWLRLQTSHGCPRMGGTLFSVFAPGGDPGERHSPQRTDVAILGIKDAINLF